MPTAHPRDERDAALRPPTASGDGAPGGGARAAYRREHERVAQAYARRPAEDARYSWRTPAYVHHIQAVSRALLDALFDAHPGPLAEARVLEVGCGTGHWLRELVQWGVRPASVAGIDLQEARLQDARDRSAAGVGLAAASAAELPFRSGSFDVILQVTAFSSVLDGAVRAAAARELLRVLAPGGALVWYDLRVDNPRNPDVRRVDRRELARLFPRCRLALRRTTLAPPLQRTLVPGARLLAEALALVPPLRTHYVGVVRPPAPISAIDRSWRSP